MIDSRLDSEQLRPVVGALAAARLPGHRVLELQLAEDAVICLLFPAALGIAATTVGCRLSPTRLECVSAALLVQAVRKTEADPRPTFAARVLAWFGERLDIEYGLGPVPGWRVTVPASVGGGHHPALANSHGRPIGRRVHGPVSVAVPRPR